jgi:hypothetical protein
LEQLFAENGFVVETVENHFVAKLVAGRRA